ncbi:MAG: hypothetical protein SGI77_12835 [Pirellulaceae bacterium]|nr:hypothetical protein [Pirellulaceae bacterium]
MFFDEDELSIYDMIAISDEKKQSADVESSRPDDSNKTLANALNEVDSDEEGDDETIDGI